MRMIYAMAQAAPSRDDGGTPAARTPRPASREPRHGHLRRSASSSGPSCSSTTSPSSTRCRAPSCAKRCGCWPRWVWSSHDAGSARSSSTLAAWNVYDPLVIRWRLAGAGRIAQLRSITELRTRRRARTPRASLPSGPDPARPASSSPWRPSSGRPGMAGDDGHLPRARHRVPPTCPRCLGQRDVRAPAPTGRRGAHRPARLRPHAAPPARRTRSSCTPTSPSPSSAATATWPTRRWSPSWSAPWARPSSSGPTRVTEAARLRRADGIRDASRPRHRER